ncbi:MAG: hypothetical protein ABI625_21620 [bacterium]
MRHIRSKLSIPFLLAGSLLLGGCPFMASPTAVVVTTPAAMTVVQGNGQTAQAGRLLATMIVLRVVDANGHGVAKQVATFVVAAGGGSVDPATAATDSSGEVRVKWTLGSASPLQSLVAKVNETIGATINATGTFPTDIVVAQGAGQSGKIVTVLKNDIVIRVVGAGNAPMIGIPVSFKVTAGGGGLSPQSGVTNAQGELATKWTMGSAAGVNSIDVSSGNLTPATVSATALP